MGGDGANSGAMEAVVSGVVVAVAGVLGDGDMGTSLRTTTFAWLRSQHHMRSHHDGW